MYGMFGMSGHGYTSPSPPKSEPAIAEDNFYENLLGSIPTTEQLKTGWRNNPEVQKKTRYLVEHCLEELAVTAFPELTFRLQISVCHYARGVCQIAYECLNERIKHVYFVQHENGTDRHIIFTALPDPDLEAAKQLECASPDGDEEDTLTTQTANS